MTIRVCSAALPSAVFAGSVPSCDGLIITLPESPTSSKRNLEIGHYGRPINRWQNVVHQDLKLIDLVLENVLTLYQEHENLGGQGGSLDLNDFIV